MGVNRHDKVSLGGIDVDLLEFTEAIATISTRARSRDGRPLGVVSVNLDHIHHFGPGQRWHGTLVGPEFLFLLDGAPLVAQAARKTGRTWPRLAGSDLIDPLLDEAERHGTRVGFLGGTSETHELLRARLRQARPDLQVSGWWAPDRSVIADPAASTALAEDINRAGTQLLLVGLGKPRQELWMARYGHLTGAGALLGFGAAVDFLAGRVARAPRWVSDRGLEWAWRLSREPVRMGRRYLVDGPVSYIAVRRDKSGPGGIPQPVPPPRAGAPVTPGVFAGPDDHAAVTALIVTYNNAGDVPRLIASLRAETADQPVRVIVADNSPGDDTVQALAAHDDVTTIPTGGNLGYAGGINIAAAHAGSTDAFLVLNPDLAVQRGAVKTMLRRLEDSAAAAVVPLLLDEDDALYHSLRREPTLSRQLGDAVLGAHLPSRPGWLSEMDTDAESYQHPHPVDWATGAAVLVRADAAAAAGPWDEKFFLYSEETDYFHRLRKLGGSIWFEPSAAMRHARGGSGSSADLTALMEVNRVRYAATHHAPPYALAVRAITAAGAIARCGQPGRRRAAAALLGLRDWDDLPRAVPATATSVAQSQGCPDGSIVIPAHNEEAVIARTLAPLADLAASGAIEVIVACNGCTDATAATARTFPGVRVLDIAEASKAAALNAADDAATRWPRLYLDADIEITPAAVGALFEAMSADGTLAARPEFRYDTTGADRLVRAYYRARRRIPGMHEHLWGAGAYAVTAAGHERFTRFPDLTADDAFVDTLFSADEKLVVPTVPVIVRTPRTTGALLGTLNRVYRGNRELAEATGTAPSVLALLHGIRGPRSCVDALVYGCFAVAGKVRSRRPGTASTAWDRDESSRLATPRRAA
ncbi:WecB/TagA/CpsF family glycosyltransferase [Specibacter cremeus]|uniref:WecB/TagA/CpsF family glycosyltransferase n=1 Tax=Specibacter cremeus TaxID=1629051 RepID=UPI001F0BB65D|nr:WecB/TagA/CpsF family glycosyltransferase [Specibacter cremeus]